MEEISRDLLSRWVGKFQNYPTLLYVECNSMLYTLVYDCDENLAIRRN